MALDVQASIRIENTVENVCRVPIRRSANPLVTIPGPTGVVLWRSPAKTVDWYCVEPGLLTHPNGTADVSVGVGANVNEMPVIKLIDSFVTVAGQMRGVSSLGENTTVRYRGRWYRNIGFGFFVVDLRCQIYHIAEDSTATVVAVFWRGLTKTWTTYTTVVTINQRWTRNERLRVEWHARFQRLF